MIRKLIIAGGRDVWPSIEYIDEAVRTLFPSFLETVEYEEVQNGTNVSLWGPTGKPIRWRNQPTLVNGACASGVDMMALEWARSIDLKIRKFPANWTDHGKAAGPIRNADMAAFADALLLLWDGKSRGSANMLKEAKKHGLKIVSIATCSPEEMPRNQTWDQAKLQFKAYRTMGVSRGNSAAISKLKL